MIYYTERYLKTGGSVCAFITSSVPFSVPNGFSDDSIESLWLHLKLPKLPSIIVCIIYHPPSNDQNALIGHISAALDLFLIKHPHA